jgi:hypothetical protein
MGLPLSQQIVQWFYLFFIRYMFRSFDHPQAGNAQYGKVRPNNGSAVTGPFPLLAAGFNPPKYNGNGALGSMRRRTPSVAEGPEKPCSMQVTAETNTTTSVLSFSVEFVILICQ